MEKGDLHWDRVNAGVYQTMFYANGYKYYIERFMDRRTPRWRAYYVWDKQKDKKNLRNLYHRPHAFDTLKIAKRACLIHNMKPRTKWKFIGRAQNIGKTPAAHPGDKNNRFSSTRWNTLVFRQIRPNGEQDTWNPKFVDPIIFGYQDYSQFKVNREMMDMGRKIAMSRGEIPLSELYKLVKKYPAYDGKPVILKGWEDYEQPEVSSRPA